MLVVRVTEDAQLVVEWWPHEARLVASAPRVESRGGRRVLLRCEHWSGSVSMTLVDEAHVGVGVERRTMLSDVRRCV